MSFTFRFTLQGLSHLAYRDQSYEAVSVESNNLSGAVALLPNVLIPRSPRLEDEETQASTKAKAASKARAKSKTKVPTGEEKPVGDPPPRAAPPHTPALHFDPDHLHASSDRRPELYFRTAGNGGGERGLMVLKELDVRFQGATEEDGFEPKGRDVDPVKDDPEDGTENSVRWIAPLRPIEAQCNPNNLKPFLVNSGVPQDAATFKKFTELLSVRCFLDHGELSSSVRLNDGSYRAWTFRGAQGQSVDLYVAHAIHFDFECQSEAVMVLNDFADGFEERLVFKPTAGELVEVVLSHLELDATLGLDIRPRLTDARTETAHGSIIQDVDFGFYYRFYELDEYANQAVGIIAAEPFRGTGGTNCNPSGGG